MVITYHGGGCFKITTGSVSILTDPESSRFKGDLVLRTQFPISPPKADPPQAGNFSAKGGSASGGQFPISGIIGPGEYEIKGIKISGVPAGASTPLEISRPKVAAATPKEGGFLTGSNKESHTVYSAEAEEMRLVFLGNPPKLPEAADWEKIGPADILFLAPAAAKTIKILNPKIAVLAFFKNAKEAAKEFDQKIEELDKLTVRKKDLGEKIRVVALKSE